MFKLIPMIPDELSARSSASLRPSPRPSAHPAIQPAPPADPTPAWPDLSISGFAVAGPGGAGAEFSMAALAEASYVNTQNDLIVVGRNPTIDATEFRAAHNLKDRRGRSGQKYQVPHRSR